MCRGNDKTRSPFLEPNPFHWLNFGLQSVWFKYCPDLSRRWGGGLLSCASLHHLAGGTLADGVYSGHPEVIVGVRAEAAHAVACRGNAINFFVRVLWAFGTMLEKEKKNKGKVRMCMSEQRTQKFYLVFRFKGMLLLFVPANKKLYIKYIRVYKVNP